MSNALNARQMITLLNANSADLREAPMAGPKHDALTALRRRLQTETDLDDLGYAIECTPGAAHTREAWGLVGF